MKKLNLLIAKIGFFVFVVVLAYGFYHSDLVYYLYRQAYGQIKVLTNTKPIDEVLADKSTPDSVRKKLILLQEIKKYGENVLGFEKNKNYTQYYEQNGKPIIWLITASSAFSLEEYVWRFPILGELSYKGFFDENLALAEKKRLDDLGYDTQIGQVAAWSTLGILPDPVLSSMLLRNEQRLADLIFHESTHVIYYAPNTTEYNENLANYVAKRSVEHYLKNKYPKDTLPFFEYKMQLRDKALLNDFVKNTAHELSLFYDSLPKNWTITQKKLAKKNKIDFLIAQLKNVKFHNPEYLTYFEDDIPNNAFFVGYLQYNALQNDFDSLFGKLDAPEIIEKLKKM